MSDQPSEPEIHQAASILGRLSKGFLPFEIFKVIAEKVALPTFELSVFRINEGVVEVLLTQRSATIITGRVHGIFQGE